MQLLSTICGVFLATSVLARAVGPRHNPNSTYTNPLLPGWNSDSSCTYVPESETFFCATSSFLVFPGIPVYASKDLINWKLASHALSRPEQVPWFSDTTDQQSGIFAVTLRHHDGTLYLITTYNIPDNASLLFSTIDPFDSASWSDPVIFEMGFTIDPDILWDDDGTVYVTTSGTTQFTLDINTAEIGEVTSIWNGTGGSSPEGPHLYKKDGYYYLMIAEGGTALGHMETIARSRNLGGPFEAYERNPILSNANTTEYFETVGHADLFQDGNGKWWGVALTTRSGPEWEIFPMGRETALFTVTWDEGEWPILDPVRGRMHGWPMPKETKDLPGNPEFINDDDEYDFAPGTSLPEQLSYWRLPAEGAYQVLPAGHPSTLAIHPHEAT